MMKKLLLIILILFPFRLVTQREPFKFGVIPDSVRVWPYDYHQTNDVWTLNPTNTYEFEGEFSLPVGRVPHNIPLSFDEIKISVTVSKKIKCGEISFPIYDSFATRTATKGLR